MRRVVAVAEVEPRDVHAVVEEHAEHLRGPAGGADGADDARLLRARGGLRQRASFSPRGSIFLAPTLRLEGLNKPCRWIEKYTAQR